LGWADRLAEGGGFAHGRAGDDSWTLLLLV
jgi:hypothetical protein